jgi:hypothetical protein
MKRSLLLKSIRLLSSPTATVSQLLFVDEQVDSVVRANNIK